MASGPHVDPLAVYDDERTHRRAWRIERAGWVLLAGFTVAASSGVLGSAGPLNQRVEQAPGLAVSYHRFVRHAAPCELRLRIPKQERTVISIDRGFLDSACIRQVLPEPAQTGTSGDRCTFTFLGGTDQVLFSIEFDGYGKRVGTVAVEGGSAVDISQYIWP